MTSRRTRPASAKLSGPASYSHREFLSSSASASGFPSATSLSFASSPSVPSLHSGSGGGLLANDRPRERDSEALSKTVWELKEQVNASEKENAFLKAQMQRLVAQLRKKERQIEQITAMKLSTADSSSSEGAVLAGQMRELRSELTAIARLTDKLRDLETQNQSKSDELRKLRSSLKFTQVKELEIEAQSYYNELRRTKKAMVILQNQLRSLQTASPTQPHGGFGGAHHAHSHSSPSSQLAYDQQMFQSLRAEVEQLRSENLRLRSESGSTGAMGSGRKSNLHVLNTITQLQAELKKQIEEEDEDQLHQQQHQSQYDSSHDYEADGHAHEYESELVDEVHVNARPQSRSRKPPTTLDDF